uniref:Uncharacterized protein n=1 Tax=Piliocolobus tephrosceles TaxID=591936 RepID=A0A8C9H7J3_9PRIM
MSPEPLWLRPLLTPHVFMLVVASALQCGRGIPPLPRTEVGAEHSVNEETKAGKVGNQASVMPATSRRAALGTPWTQTRTQLLQERSHPHPRGSNALGWVATGCFWGPSEAQRRGSWRMNVCHWAAAAEGRS